MHGLQVGVDVGCRQHRVAIATPDGVFIDEFDLDHQPVSLAAFIVRVEKGQNGVRSFIATLKK